jgi:hypothetical protein
MRYPVAETADADDQFQPPILTSVRAAVVVVGYNMGAWAV